MSTIDRIHYAHGIISIKASDGFSRQVYPLNDARHERGDWQRGDWLRDVLCTLRNESQTDGRREAYEIVHKMFKETGANDHVETRCEILEQVLAEIAS